MIYCFAEGGTGFLSVHAYEPTMDVLEAVKVLIGFSMSDGRFFLGVSYQ